MLEVTQATSKILQERFTYGVEQPPELTPYGTRTS